jgi:hypothetical protein
MGITVINKTMDEKKRYNFYRASVHHLRKAAPNLQEIELMGGYLWNLGINEKVGLK